MTPFLESAGGNCQDAVILVEVLAVEVKLPGGCEGTAIEKSHYGNYNNHNDKQNHCGHRYLLIIINDKLAHKFFRF